MLNDLQQKTLSRLCYLFEFSPCNTMPLDYELQSKGFVKINKMNFKGKEYIDTTIKKEGAIEINYLRNKKRNE